MAKDKGWVKIYRDIQSHWIWTDKPFSMGQAWIDLVLTANHENVKIIFNGELITIKAGQTITSIRKLSEKWGWSKDKTLNFLKILSDEKMIERESDRFKTLLTIVNYGEYQVLSDTKKTPNGHRTDTKQDTDKDTKPSQTRMNRMKKNDKEGKEIYMPSADSDSDDEGWMDPMELQKMMKERGKS